jgi:cytochrome c oxidase subunit 2
MSTHGISIRAILLAATGLASGMLSACGGNQSAVSPAGVQSGYLDNLWWIFFYVTGSVYVIVMAVVLIAFVRRRKGTDGKTQTDASDSRAKTTIKGALVVTAVILFGLLFMSFRTGKAINALSEKTPELAIKITGHQWWWEVEYQDENVPSNNVTTANEIHVPVGRPVKLMLQSNDVIHSLWMPNFHGKKDLIPIYPTTFYFQADTPGEYWGQCAEFCGYQHAKMRFQVIAQSPEDFQKWLDAGRKTPPTPTDPDLARGEEIFTTSVCAQCHTIQGTGTGGRVGPNLTHVASRPYLAGATLENTPDNMAKWITDPHQFKPGNRMPMNQYSDEDLAALVKYLQSLK